MKEYILVGGFDYAIRFEINPNSILHGIDVIVDTEGERVGERYLDKEVVSLEYLHTIEKDNAFLIIGSVIRYSEIKMMLLKMGFIENRHFVWGLVFAGDERCERLWNHVDWKADKNIANRDACENGEYATARLRFVSNLIEEKVHHVIDLGAASGRMREYLDESIEYYPVDYIRYNEKQIVCDFNKYEFPKLELPCEETACLLIGVLQYVFDWKWLLKEIANVCDCFICAHTEIVRINREYRKQSLTWNSALFDADIIIEMQKNGFILVESYDFRLRATIMKFIKEKNNEI